MRKVKLIVHEKYAGKQSPIDVLRRCSCRFREPVLTHVFDVFDTLPALLYNHQRQEDICIAPNTSSSADRFRCRYIILRPEDTDRCFQKTLTVLYKSLTMQSR